GISPARSASSHASGPSVYSYGGASSTLGFRAPFSDALREVRDTRTPRTLGRSRRRRRRTLQTLPNLRYETPKGSRLLPGLRQKRPDSRRFTLTSPVIRLDRRTRPQENGNQHINPVSDTASLLQQQRMRRSQRSRSRNLPPEPRAAGSKTRRNILSHNLPVPRSSCPCDFLRGERTF